MKTLRIVCGAIGALHYSSTPDLAMDSCPVCGEACREIEVERESETEKTLLDLMYEADALQIDDTFIRYFSMENDLDPDEDDEEPIVCHIEIEQDYNTYEYFFTEKELREAVYDNIRGEWRVANQHADCIIPYKLNEIKA